MPPRQEGSALPWPALDSLWPAGSRRLTRRPGRAPALLVLPSRRAPRMLVPTGLPQAGAMLERHSTSRRQRLGQTVLGRGVSSGLLPLLPVWRLVAHDGAEGVEGGEAASIESYVRAQLPAARSVGVLLGPPRANAKPVLRVFDDAGATIAYGKVGHNALAASLVRSERAVLQSLSGESFDHLELPTVLHAGAWRGLEVLLLSALGAAGRAEPSWELPLPAMFEVAEHGRTGSGPVADSSYLRGLQERASSAGGPTGIDRHLDAVLGCTATTELSYGRWHGDWAPWNMGPSRTRVQLWDWERSQTDVPLGFDIAHFVLQKQFRDGAPAPAAAAALLEVTGGALRRWYAGRDQVDATVLLYLCEILQRYVADGGPSPSPALRNRVATIGTIITRITGQRSEELHVDA